MYKRQVWDIPTGTVVERKERAATSSGKVAPDSRPTRKGVFGRSGRKQAPTGTVVEAARAANPEFEHWFPEHCRPGWSAHQNIDMCEQGDVEAIHNWRETHSIEDLQRIVEQKGYSAVCVAEATHDGRVFGLAVLKKFPYQLTAGHCKPSQGYTNTLYIWSGGGSGEAVPAVVETVGEAVPAREPPPLHDIVDALKRNLGLDGTWPEVVDAACLQLGVAPTGSLQEKGDACWRAMEG